MDIRGPGEVWSALQAWDGTTVEVVAEPAVTASRIVRASELFAVSLVFESTGAHFVAAFRAHARSVTGFENARLLG